MKEVVQSLLAQMHRNNPDLCFEIHFWDGEKNKYGDGEPKTVLKFNTEKSVKRVFSDGYLGFGEEYMNGNIDIEGDFQEPLKIAFDPAFENLKLSLLHKLKVLKNYLATRDTLRRTPENIQYHYDLGNDFYKLWLDKSMTYSCAYFKNETDTLEEAQQQKYEHICRKLLLKAGDTLIDVGCGWGGMMFYAVKHYGVKATGCTLSKQQYAYILEKIKQENLQDSVTVLLKDYRTITGQYDKFVSIGMFEHVGKKFIPTFFDHVQNLLKPKGIGLLHTIGKDTASSPDEWTMKYIFPGGYIPVIDEILNAMGRRKLNFVDVENLRLHYSMTLDEWSRRYETHADDVRKLFDERFVRMWRLFLNGSSVGFRFGNTRLFQIAFTHGLNNEYPLTREFIYGE
ncbi:MAG TPA: class I SAM-dependent methyltransferase [Bacteroidetes bacterium]|nr:class I SAM-dependent methyltransferase [Bacteroidota bacterium]